MKKTPPGFTRTLLSIAIPVTLQNLLAVLKQPADQQEQQQLNDYCQNRFNGNLNTPLTHAQLNDVIQQLFTRRLDKAGHAPSLHSDVQQPQPLLNPLIAALPQPLQSVFSKPLALVIGVIVLALVVWALF